MHPYGPSPYDESATPHPFGVVKKWGSFSTFFTEEKTVSAEIFVASVAGVILVVLVVSGLIWLYYKRKWKRFEHIPRVNLGDLVYVEKLGAGHFGDVAKEKYKVRANGTSYMPE